MRITVAEVNIAFRYIVEPNLSSNGNVDEFIKFRTSVFKYRCL